MKINKRLRRKVCRKRITQCMVILDGHENEIYYGFFGKVYLDLNYWTEKENQLYL